MSLMRLKLRDERGATLIEVMVALLVLAILLAPVLAFALLSLLARRPKRVIVSRFRLWISAVCR